MLVEELHVPEIFENGVLVGSGELACITGVKRDPAQALGGQRAVRAVLTDLVQRNDGRPLGENSGENRDERFRRLLWRSQQRDWSAVRRDQSTVSVSTSDS